MREPYNPVTFQVILFTLDWPQNTSAISIKRRTFYMMDVPNWEHMFIMVMGAIFRASSISGVTQKQNGSEAFLSDPIRDHPAHSFHPEKLHLLCFMYRNTRGRSENSGRFDSWTTICFSRDIAKGNENENKKNWPNRNSSLRTIKMTPAFNQCK